MRLLDDPHEEMQLLAARSDARSSAEREAAQWTPEMVQRAIDLQKRAPHALPSVVMGAVKTGMSDDDFFSLASTVNPGEDARDYLWSPGAWSNGVFGPAKAAFATQMDYVTKPVVRGALAMMDTAFKDLIQRPALAQSALHKNIASRVAGSLFGVDREDERFDAVGVSSTNPFEAYTSQAASPMVQGALNLADSDPSTTFDIGTGFFPAGQNLEQYNEKSTLQIDGQAANMGRLVANGTLGMFGAQPGERAYDLTAGVAQFVSEVVFDPTAMVTGPVSAARAVAKAGRADEVASSAEYLTSALRALRSRSNGVPEVAAKSGKGVPELGASAGTVIPDAAPSVPNPYANLSEPEILNRMYGLVNGRNKTVLLDKVLPWVKSTDVVDAIAKTDGYTLREAWLKRPDASIPESVIGELGRTTDPQKIVEILSERLAMGEMRGGTFFRGWRAGDQLVGNAVGRTLFDGKFKGLALTGTLDSKNLEVSVGKVDSLLRQAKVSREVRSEMWERGVSLAEGDGVGFARWADEASQLVQRNIVGDVLEDDALAPFFEHVSSVVNRTVKGFNLYNTSAMGESLPGSLGRWQERLNEAGEVVIEEVADPHVFNELARGFQFMLPDPKAVRRAAVEHDVLRRVAQSSAWDLSERLARVVTTGLFKPLSLVRPAYLARVLPDDVARMAAAGWENVATDRQGFLATYVHNPKAARDLLGNDLRRAEEAKRVLNADLAGMAGRTGKDLSIGWDTYYKQPTGWTIQNIKAWRRELGELASPEIQYLARNQGDVEGLLSIYFTRDMKNPEHVQIIANIDRMAKNATFPYTYENLRGVAESWVERLNVKTGGSDELMRLVAGDIPGKNLHDPETWDKINRVLKRNHDEFMPPTVKGEATKRVPGSSKPRLLMDSLFEHIVSRPTAELTRFPLWNQAIGGALKDMMPSISRDLRSTVVKQAENLNLSDEIMTSIREAAAKANAGGHAGFVDDLIFIDKMAKARGAEVVEDLLFDVSSQSAFQEQFVSITPFVDAWREGLTVWSRLVKENPMVLTRTGSVLNASNRNGVIYTNEDGERMFASNRSSIFAGMAAGVAAGAKAGLPGVLAGAALGGVAGTAAGAVGEGAVRSSESGEVGDVRRNMEFRASGVNLMLTGIGPGFGPIVQWPVSAFSFDDGLSRDIADFVAPFGSDVEDPTDLLSIPTLAKSVTPAWAEKAFNGFLRGEINEGQWHRTVDSVLKHTEMSGQYTDEQLRDPQLLDEISSAVERKARWLLFIQGLAQSTLITGPSFNSQVRTEKNDIPVEWDRESDPDGVWHDIGVLAQDWYAMVEFYDDPNLATEAFIQTYGVEPHYLKQSKTSSVIGGTQVNTAEGKRWLDENRDLAMKYQLVSGYFAPFSEAYEFDYDVYGRNLDEGIVTYNRPEDSLRLANASRARQMVYAQKTLLESQGIKGKELDYYMGHIMSQIEEQFPGWRFPIPGHSDGVRVTDQIAQLREAAFDPAMESSPLTPSLKKYMEAREVSLRTLREGSGEESAGLGRKDALVFRDYLKSLGQELSSTDETFGQVWRVLAYELEVESDGNE